MKNTIAEYGFLIIAIVILVAFFMSIVPMFMGGGTIRNEVLDYVTTLC